MAYYGGVEAGGTKFICAIARRPHQIVASTRFPTTTPEETIPRTIAFFEQERDNYPLAALGIATFGPVDLNPASETYGYITSTPKPGWANTDFGRRLAGAFDLPLGVDTDVNGAALAESLWGAGKGLDNVLYLTIGTGIGGGGLINGQLLHGLLHPEMGHMRIPHDVGRDPFPGVCPFHGDCLEGLANGPALAKRWGKRAEKLPPDHPAWALEAHYLALALVNLIYALSPQRIILGGGVMEQHQLFPRLRTEVQELLNGYLQVPEVTEQIDDYIVPPMLGPEVGVLGAIALAQQAEKNPPR